MGDMECDRMNGEGEGDRDREREGGGGAVKGREMETGGLKV